MMSVKDSRGESQRRSEGCAGTKPVPSSVDQAPPTQGETVLLTKDLAFTTPKDPGLYLYVVSAQWPEGDLDYAFKILVSS